MSDPLDYLASEYFTFMLDNRTRLREFVDNFQVVLTEPSRNYHAVAELCSEFNAFRMEPLRDSLGDLEEVDLDTLDNALLGKLKGFSEPVAMLHQQYEQMRNEIEKTLVVKSGPVLIRGLVV